MEELHKGESQRNQRQNLRESKVAKAGRNKHKRGSGASKCSSTQHVAHASEGGAIRGRHTYHAPRNPPSKVGSQAGAAMFC